MSQIISLGNTILAQNGKKGDLKPMADGSGYWLINGGGFNIPNRHGITYPFNRYLQECMGKDSDFERRIKEGQMYCELDHPKPWYNLIVGGQVVRKEMTELFEWVNRLKMIDMDNIGGHIREIHWDASKGITGPVLFDVEITPFGDKEWFLKASLPNPSINTALSIRTVTAPLEVGGKIRDVEYWSTIDIVPEQGVLRACKHLTAGLESFLSSYVPTDAEQDVIETTMEELLFVCSEKIKNPAVQEQYAGVESFDRLKKMVEHLKRNVKQQHKPAKLVVSHSFGAFR